MDFSSCIIRKKVSSRGGGVEIDLTPFGFKGEKMAAYQNYLGGGLLGAICVNDTIRAYNPFVELSVAEELDKIGEELKRYYHALTNPDDEWESTTYEQNQKLPASAY